MNIAFENALTKHDHIIGIKTAPLMLLEYGDYECPSCGASFLVAKKVVRELGENIAFVFRNFPLTDIHPNAFDAALAAEAAAVQNKFWEMYDLLFRNQEHLEGDELFSYAKRIGLNMRQFGQDVKSGALASKIEADLQNGLKSGVSGTPSFYINGEKFDGDWEDGALAEYLKGLL